MKKGSIGNWRKGIHWIREYDFPTQWGVGACGSWAGRVELVDDRATITCPYCFLIPPDGCQDVGTINGGKNS